MEQKTIWMQLLLIGLISLTFNSSCEKGPDHPIEDFIYQNLSTHHVFLFSYKAAKISTWQIANSGNLKQTQYESNIDSLIINADSVKVIYDSLRFEVYKKGTVETNLLYRESYRYQKIQSRANNHHERTFTFTEDSYNLARPM